MITMLAARSASRIGVFDAYALLRRRLTGSQVAVLIYHRVCPISEPEYLDALSAEAFERQMVYFSENYEIISLDKLVGCIRGGKRLPEQAIVVTFDDGYKDNYQHAYPILQEYHIPATIFLATGYIDTDQLFWWDKVGYAVYHTSVRQVNVDYLGSLSLESQVDRSRSRSLIIERLKELPSCRVDYVIGKLLDACHVEIPDGLGRNLFLSWKEVEEMSLTKTCEISFGAHSVTHNILVNMPLNRVEEEIVQSKKDIERRVGKQVNAFSYPNGCLNAEIVNLVRKSGFTCAVSILNGQLISSEDDAYQLSRIRVREDFDKSKAVLCGLWGDVQVAARRMGLNPRLFI